jgi:hypothetical protein
MERTPLLLIEGRLEESAGLTALIQAQGQLVNSQGYLIGINSPKRKIDAVNQALRCIAKAIAVLRRR